MTAAAPASTAELGPSDGSVLRQAELRGATTIAPRVVEKIARRAAKEEDGVLAPPSSRLAPIFAGPSGPVVDAHVDGTSVWLEVRAGLRYPLPLVTSARRLQARLRTAVESLTHLQVMTVEVRLAPMADVDQLSDGEA
jgi:uncharacterized alkaline shock family protein YloU